MDDRVLILGGGLAGLAAATALAPLGFDVTIIEAKGRFGGRAGSFQDATTGQLIDVCQHVSMGCCTNFANWCKTVGIAPLIQPQKKLYFMTQDGRVSTFAADPIPAPFHLSRSFFGAHYLSFPEKLRLIWGLACLRFANEEQDPPFMDWLLGHRQTQRTIDYFWSVVLTSALNESCERIGLRYARKVFVDGFLRHRRGFEVELPVVPLGRLYGKELQETLERLRVRVSFQTAARGLELLDGRVKAVASRQLGLLEADWVISSIPFDRVLDLLPESERSHEFWQRLESLKTSPITSVHVWYDRPVLDLPHVVLVGCVGQWIFNRGEVGPGEYYVQVVVSASRQFRGLGHDEVERRIISELSSLFPAAKEAKRLRSRVITEHGATFSVVPGVDRLRPSASTPISNLLLAGDWTATGWPATMEGAVRSGYLAAEELLRRSGRPAKIVQPDL